MKRIIFLDVDGPIIPGTSYLYQDNPSDRQIFDPRCTAIVREICIASGAEIVMNTTHNNTWSYDEGDVVIARHETPGLRDRLVEAGLGEFLHDASPRTGYGLGDRPSRIDAINTWLSQNGDANWIALDDAPIDSERAFRISFEHGVDMAAYNHAAKWFDFKNAMVLG